MNEQFLRPKDAAKFFGISESTLWDWAKKFKDFPKKRKIGERAVGWWMSELKEWVEKQNQLAS